MKKVHFTIENGQMLVELVMAIGIAAIILPALLTGLVASRQGRPQQQQSIQGTELFKETATAVREVRDNSWTTFAVDGTYHPVIVNNAWTLATGSATTNGFTQQVVISNVNRDSSGNIVSSGGTVDPSTKQVVITISWTKPQATTLSATDYLTRTTNLTHTETTTTDFNAGTLTNAQVTNVSGGEVQLGNDNNAKWCSPSFSSNSINLPDGPPVAVAATASAVTTSIPDDVFVATAPYATSSVKLAYVNVTANTATPAATLHGIFTLDSTKYSAGKYPATLGGLTNSFITNDVKYYTSSSNNLYALMTTTDPSHEVIAVQVKTNGTDSFQDPVNDIYKYWTFFNTKIYSSAATNDQTPFGSGAISLTILGNTGYVDSGGYLYAFNLSNIDSKSPTTGLDQIGCRILLDGYDCKPSNAQNPNGLVEKYGSGQTGTSYSDTNTPVHPTCSDGGNIELDADHQISGVTVGGHNYIYVAVGAATNPELDIVDATTVPTGGTLTNNSCGRGTNGGWQVTSSLDFDPANGTEEAANSVYAKSDGTRAYMSSNGGITTAHGITDSDQFYIIDTTNKSSPKFLTTWPSNNFTSPGHYAGTAETGEYNGTGSNLYLYPRRALTVQNGQRAILVGVDGNPSDNNQAQQYQVLDLSNESTPAYCGGLNFTAGFNDMTSITEADGDNFVYMVANTPDHQLKIIQGGPDNAIYDSNGTFESQTFDTASVDGSTLNRAFNRLLSDISQPTNTTIKIQTAVAPAVNNSCSGVTFNYVGPDGTSNTYFTASGSTIAGIIPLADYIPTSNYDNPGRCFRYKVFLSTLDQTLTPVLYDTTWNYSQ
jgi:hypothetical protein